MSPLRRDPFDPSTDPSTTTPPPLSNERPVSNASPNAPPTPALFSQYRKGEGVYDELYDASGVRGAWRPFVQAIEGLGVEGFKRRWQQANRALNRNGLAYSSWKENEKEARPWELDPIPLLIASEDWDIAVKGLQQRARLLEAILTDIYGHQELMKSGVLPPEVVFSHPGFCRPFHRQRPPANHFLHFYAADMARAPNGKWWVLADRTEAPSGAGFVLENRLIQSRTLPTIFHQANVQRLAQYFLAFKRAVAAAAPRVENPRVVILSQGSGGPNYFEDAYLARYLGYTLVEASDLAIRNHRVMLKTLGGLIQVDVIIRRPNSDQCDSLELSHTAEGVPGLLQASRNGNVAVINPLGSGLVESPIFMAFMPKLCQELFGEPLLMPGVATWWCGDPGQMDHVLANLDTLIVKRSYRMRGRELAFANMVRNQSREATIKMIRSDPHQYVGQEVVKRSTCPVWKSQGIAPAPIAMRAFAVASGDDFEVMQGGLVRVSAAPDPLEMSILAGEKSKDAWILSQGPVNRVSLLKKAGGPIDLKRTGGELPSRVAENLFWLGRNLERADVCARLLRATIVRLTSESILEEQPETPALLRALADIGQIETGYGIEEIRKQLPPLETALPPAVFDASDSFSLRAIVTEIFRLTTRSRDRVSSDSWRILHRIDKSFTPPAVGQWDLSDLLTLLDDLILDLAAFSGIVSESMTRTQIYYFLDMGRRIERALQQVRLLRNCLIEPTGDLTAILEALLEISDSSMTYRSRYLADVQMPAVLDLLLTDETNPRSIARQLVQLLDHVNALPHNTSSGLFSLEQRLAMTLLNETRMCDVTAFRESEDLNPNAPLSLLLQDIESLLPKLADALSNRYLVHAGAQVQLTEIRS